MKEDNKGGGAKQGEGAYLYIHMPPMYLIKYVW